MCWAEIFNMSAFTLRALDHVQTTLDDGKTNQQVSVVHSMCLHTLKFQVKAFKRLSRMLKSHFISQGVTTVTDKYVF